MIATRRHTPSEVRKYALHGRTVEGAKAQGKANAKKQQPGQFLRSLRHGASPLIW
jgi:hypothetical protein